MSTITKEQQKALDEYAELGEEATEYEVQICPPDNEMRVQLLDDDGVICTLTMNSFEAYTFAQKILRGYDKLEGL